jgi:ABC-type uncharacterized transport system involved in gliding motility auxiliary subunit
VALMTAWPALLGALGGVAFGFGLLSALMALFQPLVPMGWVVINLAGGALMLVASAVASIEPLRQRLRSGASRRRGIHASTALARAGLSLAIIGMLAFLSTRYTHRFDWTEQQVNTLAAESLELVGRLEAEVQLMAFFKARDSLQVRDLLARYAHASDRVSVRFIDPNVRPDLVEAHGLDEAELARGLVLATWARAGAEGVAQETDAATDGIRITQFNEFEITNALAKLSDRANRKVYFLGGHNERAWQPQEGEGEAKPARDSLDQAAAALRKISVDVAPLLLATDDEGVPEDADALIVAGPTRPLFDHEIEMLERYLAAGGALMVMIDPRARTNLYEPVRAWGAEIGDDVLVDPVLSLNRQPTAPLAGGYAEGHPIVSSLGRTVYPMARSVVPVPSSGLSPVVFTSESGWAERDIEGWVKSGRATLDEDDLAGQVPLFVAGRPTSAGAEAGRLVVIGDSSFATNEYIDAFANRDLLLNAVSWLLGDEAQIAVRPNVARASSVVLTAGQFQAIQYLSLFVLPEGIAIAGVLAWWSRRRRAGSPA